VSCWNLKNDHIKNILQHFDHLPFLSLTKAGGASVLTFAAKAAKLTPLLQSRTAASSSFKLTVLASATLI
jgi:hypothetical protein